MDFEAFHYFEFREVSCDVPGKNGIFEIPVRSFEFQLLRTFYESQWLFPSDWTVVGGFRRISLFRVPSSGLWRHWKKWNFLNNAQQLLISNVESLSWDPEIISERLDGSGWIPKNFTIPSSETWPMTSPEKMEFSKYRSKASNFSCWELFMSPNDYFGAIGRL